MAFIDNFADWMHDTVIVQKTTRNAFGERVVSSSLTILNGFVRYVDRIVRTLTGEEKRIQHIVYLAGDAAVSLDDFLILPDGGRREILQIKREKDEDGTIDHVEILL